MGFKGVFITRTSFPDDSLFQSDTMFIEKETERWEDVNNPVVKVASAMATQLKHMTYYVSYQGPITVSYCKSGNVRKNLIFANICEFVASRK